MKIGVDRTLALFAFVIVLAGSTLVVTRSLEAHSTTRAVSEISQQTGSKQTTSQSISTLLTRNLQDVFGENDPALSCVEDDLVHLFYSWFNRGFLVMQRITWSTPADILERIIRYEAVHTIKGWDDLRSRLQPPDRRCYAFFHPSLVDEPLIFVEVALTSGIPGSIQDILAEDRAIVLPEQATPAVFYSISNCQTGLKGVSSIRRIRPPKFATS